MSSLNLDMATKVWRCALPKGCNKLVLQCFIHHLNDTSGLSWPSIGRVARMCGMSERTVQGHVRALQAAGILRARLRTGRTTRYAIHTEALAALVLDTDTVVLDDGETPGLALTPATFATNLQVFAPQPAKNDIKPVEICTLTVDRTVDELPRTAAPASPDAVVVVSEEIDPKVLADFAAIRKAKTRSSAPLTATALQSLREEAGLAGLTLEQALKVCCNRNWARFEAAWLTSSSTSSAPASSAAPAPALWKPPVSKLAEPEVRAAGCQRLSLIKQTTPAPVPPVEGIQIGASGPGWAQAIVARKQAGQFVSAGVLQNACIALKLTPASLRAAGMH